MTSSVSTPGAIPNATAGGTPAHVVLPILGAVALAHLLNDLLQSLVVASYPMLKAEFALSFTQVGMIACASLITASVLQPLVGWWTDRRPMPFSLVLGMASTLGGLIVLAHAGGLAGLMIGAALVGIGSSIFHPEGSRIARLASGGRFGFAQSLFQVGGNLGSSLGPIAAALVVLPRGQGAIAWFALAALLAIVVLTWVGRWYATHQSEQIRNRATKPAPALPALPPHLVTRAMIVLVVLVLSKFCYLAGLSSYYTFYLIERFQLTTQDAQIELFGYLFASAAGTFLGGPIGDRIGRKRVIWLSILGAAPFALILPWADLQTTRILAAIVGFIMASAFSAIVVYAQELMPNRIGMVSGLFFGLAFGIGGVAAAGLGVLADHAGVEAVYRWCSWIPLVGLITLLLPEPRKSRAG